MHYYDNPKGMIPTWLINWGAKVGQCVLQYVLSQPWYAVWSSTVSPDHARGMQRLSTISSGTGKKTDPQS